MPPPPIPSRNEETKVMPPPIPSRDDGGESVAEPAPPMTSPVRRPAGAVATVMASGLASSYAGAGAVDSAAHHQYGGGDDNGAEDQPHGNPYDLKAEAGSTVTASYPFQGEESLQQLSFAVGDRIKIKQKEEMWSWGILERGGTEGWFPHNYVGSTFMPLPGIHEMAAKLRERREKQDAEQARDAASAASDTTAKDGEVDAEAGAHQGADAVSGTGATGPPSNAAAAAEDISGDRAALSSKSADGGTESGVAQDGGPAAEDAQNVDPEQNAAAAAPAPEASPKSTSSSARTTGPKMVPQAAAAAAAAPSLPPFSKGGAALAGATAAPTQQVSGDTSAAAALEQGTQIDGVGYEGAPPNASTKCKCCIM